MGPIWMSTIDTGFQFKIRGCTNATLMLSLDPKVHTNSTYYIDIGGIDGHNILIRHFNNNGDLVKDISAYHSRPLLDCSLPKEFWVDWRFGIIKVGDGLPGVVPLIEFTDSQPTHVYGIGLASSDNLPVLWSFDVKPGKLITLFTIILLCHNDSC